MEKKLPRIMVGRHQYEIDMRAGELRSVYNPKKTLELFKMDRTGDGLTFWYDHDTMKIVPKPAQGETDTIKCVLFETDTLDPEFSKQILAEGEEARQLIREGKSIYNQKGGIHASPSIPNDRPRLLPMVNLYGTEFFLDLRLKEFRQVDNPANTIAWKHLEPDEFHLTLWYDTTTKNAFTGTYSQTKQQDHLKALVLPPLDLMIREGIKRHEEKIEREGDLIAERMDKILQRGDDDIYEARIRNLPATKQQEAGKLQKPGLRRKGRKM